MSSFTKHAVARRMVGIGVILTAFAFAGAAAATATEPATTHPTTPPPPATTDTYVPAGITLNCSVDGRKASCSWSGGVVSGFAKFLLLRGNGGTKGRVPYMTSDPSATAFVDTGLAPGSYSYVVVSVNANSKALVHSNPVYVQIVAPA